MPSSLGQQRGHHPVGDTGVEALPAPRRQRVDLVEEHQRRRGVAGAAEQFAHGLLRRADPLVHQFGALDRVHRQPSRAGQRPHHERLAAAGRAVEQHAARRLDAEPLEGLGMLQRPQHRLGERLLGFGHVADVLERHRSDRHLFGGRPRQRTDDAQRTGQVVLRQGRRLIVEVSGKIIKVKRDPVRLVRRRGRLDEPRELGDAPDQRDLPLISQQVKIARAPTLPPRDLGPGRPPERYAGRNSPVHGRTGHRTPGCPATAR